MENRLLSIGVQTMANSELARTAQDLIPYITPFLPYLLKAGKEVGTEAAKSLGKRLGEEIPGVVKALLTRLWPKIENNPTAKEAAIDVVEQPGDSRAIAALELQLERLLDRDEEFRREILALLNEAKAEGIVIKTNLKIEEHAGELRVIDIQDGASLEESGVRRIDAQAEITRTEKGSSTTGVHFGRLGNNVESGDDG
jgi:hypothetical protein